MYYGLLPEIKLPYLILSYLNYSITIATIIIWKLFARKKFLRHSLCCVQHFELQC